MKSHCPPPSFCTSAHERDGEQSAWCVGGRGAGQWVGNTEEVAEDHYLIARDEDFDLAAGKATPKTTLSAFITAAQALSPETRKAVSPATVKDTAVSVPPRGVERRPFPTENLPLLVGGAAKSGAVGPDMDELVRLLAALTPAQRELLLGIARSATG
jgi:hypothetical protein